MSGAVPPPAARPPERAARVPRPRVPGAVDAGVWTQHRPHSVRPCGLALLAMGVRKGVPGGGAFHRCEGRLVSGAVTPPAARPPERAARVPTRDTRVAEPWLHAPEDERPGEGQRLTPGAPHNGGRHPPRDALPPPHSEHAGPQGARCGAGAGSTRPHRPHPGRTGRGTLAARSGGRAAGGGTAPDTRRPSQRWKAAPPGDALPPPPQRATPARKGARCGAGAGSTRPHRPHPGPHGSRNPAARSGRRAAGGGTAPGTKRPSQRWKAAPPGTPFRHPHSEQRRPARAHAVGPMLGPHARIDRRPVCPGCGRCGRVDPAPAPQRAPLRAGVARCGGGGRASPGGAAFHRCEGRLVSGAVPPPAARPPERAARVPRPVRPGCGRCGRVDPAPAPQRAPCGPACSLWGGGRASRGGCLPPL